MAEQEETQSLEQVAEANEAEIDASLDAAFVEAGLEEASEPENKGPERDENGRFKSSKTEEEETPERVEPADEDNDKDLDAADEPESKYSDEDIQKAIAALHRDAGGKVPKSVLDAVNAGDESAIEYALHRAKNQHDIDNKFDDHKRTVEELKQAKEAASRPAEPESSGDTTEDDPGQLLAKVFEETFGDDTITEDVRKSFRGMQDSTRKEVEQIISEQVNNRVEKIEAAYEAMQTAQARDQLISEYPQIKDKDTWAKIQERSKQIKADGDTADLLTRLDYAARIELAPEIAKQVKAERKKRNDDRDKGVMNPGADKHTPDTAKGDQSLSDDALDALMSGDDDRAAEIYREMNKR